MRRGGLTRRYLLVLVALVTGALVAGGAIQLRASYSENQAALVALQREKALGAAARIEAFVRDIERQLGWTTHAPLVTTDAALDARQLDAVRLQRQAPPITELTYIDGEGREQLFVSRLVPDRRRSGLDLSREPKFREARGGRAWFGPVYFRKESEPYMTIAAPMAGGGVAAADVNLKFILDVVSQIKVGTTGLAFAVDGQGSLIAHPDISLVLQKTDLSRLEQVRRALAPASGDEPIIGRDVKGVEVLTANSRIPSLGWVVFVEQPVTEAYAPVRASAYRVVIVVIVGIALSVVVSVVLARRLARPIQTLQESAARIGAGELDHQITLRTGDELESLAGEFNRMTGRLRESYATLEQKVDDRTRELSESLEQQTATGEILRVISSSPTDVAPVMAAVAENAARLCDASDAQVLRVDGEILRLVAAHGLTAMEGERPILPGTAVGRAVLERRTVHIADIRDALDEFPDTTAPAHGVRAILAVPLVREGHAIGVIRISRPDARPFTDKQIALLQTFADQAVIAIENVRLFTALEARNVALTEALDQQTATAEILRVISASPTGVQPVLDAVAENAARVCGATDAIIMRVEGDLIQRVAHFGHVPLVLPEVRPLTRYTVSGRAILEGRTIHIPDITDPGLVHEYPVSSDIAASGLWRATLGVPLMRHGVAIGAITIRRGEPRLFSDKQVELLQTFADQAVIAIENVRLFKELQQKNAALGESLEQQTATGEILRAISNSPTDVQPVFETIVRSALRLLDGRTALVQQVVGEEIHLAALTVVADVADDAVRATFPIPVSASGLAAHVIDTRRPYVIADVATDPMATDNIRRTAPLRGYRSVVLVPMLREDRAIGIIAVTRADAGGFTADEVDLLQTFADQAVIAIENVRLFKELETRNAALTEALNQQTATADILGVISSSPTDLQPVFDAILDSATRLCEAQLGGMFRWDGALLTPVAVRTDLPAAPAFWREPYRPTPASGVGRAIATREAVHIVDILDDPAYREGDPQRVRAVEELHARTCLWVPLLKQDQVIGTLTIYRHEVRPFSDKQIALVQTFADQAVIAIENVRLFTELQVRTADLTRSVGELEALGEVGRAISSTLDLDRVLETIIFRANALSDTEGGAIYEFDEATREFHLRAIQNFSDELMAALRTAHIVYGQGAVGRAAAERQPVQVADVAAPGYESSSRDLLLRAGYRSLLAVPLLSEDEVVGVLVVNRRVPGEFPPRVIELLRTFGTQSALAIQNARLFREIEDKSRQLESANLHKDEFLASMSHELRTPLNAVIGFSEVLLEKMFGDVNAKQEEYLNDILASGRHLLSLINDILDLAKIEAGRMDLDIEDFDLAPAIDNALVLIRERATRKNLTLDTRLAPGLGGARGDQRKIKQVLVNLLSNAVKFTPDGGRITVQAQRVDGYVEISVIDTGIGIAAEDFEAVFEEFRQVGTDYAKKYEGTGLGLALSRKFVELHGGRIWLKSRLGEGSTFTFTIPVA